MKATGFVRRIDALGRVVLPTELRYQLGVDKNTLMQIHREGNTIVLQKHRRGCTFCGDTMDLVEYRERPVCKPCIADLSRIVGS